MSTPARFDFAFVADDGPTRLRVTLNGSELSTSTIPLARVQWEDEKFRERLRQMMTDIFEAGRRIGKHEVQKAVQRELGL